MAADTPNQTALATLMKLMEALPSISATPPGLRRTADASIAIPESMSLTQAATWLTKMDTESKQKVAISASFPNVNPFEAAAALATAITDTFGFYDQMATPSFFGDKPPYMLQVRTGPSDTDMIHCPWGRMSFPGLASSSYIQTVFAVGAIPSFSLSGEVLKGEKPKIDLLIAKFTEYLRTKSIYKGRALQVDFSYLWNPDQVEFDLDAHQPMFLDLSGLSPSDLIFNPETQSEIEVSLFTPILHSDACRSAGIPLKRGILLASSWGMGKTLTARVTAQLAATKGWTFLLCSDTRDLPYALEMAAKLQPCVVFAEDIDRLMTDRSYSSDKVLNIIDGIKAKTAEIITVLTTNNIEGIEPALLRPGRLDSVIAVQTPTPPTVVRLLKKFGSTLLSPTTDLTDAAELLSSQNATPSVVREVIERSKLSAISRLGTADIDGKVLGEDLLVVVRQMAHHVSLLQPKPEADPIPVQSAKILAAAISHTPRAHPSTPALSDAILNGSIR